MTDWITDIPSLEAHYGTPAEASIIKVADRLTAEYRAWIEASPFVALATIGSGGLDCSPRGDVGPVARALDPQHLAIPDWRGNNRIDNLRNIVEDGRVALMFMVPGSGNVIRVNGTARVTADPEMCGQFEFKGKTPRSVIVTRIDEMYFQCARAIMRSNLWSGGFADAKALPTPGQIIAALSRDGFDGETYDREWPAKAQTSLW